MIQRKKRCLTLKALAIILIKYMVRNSETDMCFRTSVGTVFLYTFSWHRKIYVLPLVLSLNLINLDSSFRIGPYPSF